MQATSTVEIYEEYILFSPNLFEKRQRIENFTKGWGCTTVPATWYITSPRRRAARRSKGVPATGTISPRHVSLVSWHNAHSQFDSLPYRFLTLDSHFEFKAHQRVTLEKYVLLPAAAVNSVRIRWSLMGQCHKIFFFLMNFPLFLLFFGFAHFELNSC